MNSVRTRNLCAAGTLLGWLLSGLLRADGALFFSAAYAAFFSWGETEAAMQIHYPWHHKVSNKYRILQFTYYVLIYTTIFSAFLLILDLFFIYTISIPWYVFLLIGYGPACFIASAVLLRVIRKQARPRRYHLLILACLDLLLILALFFRGG